MMMTKKEKKRVPELRFEGFEGEWERKKYKNIYSFITTNSYSRIQLNYEKGEVKNIHYGDIHTKFPTLFDITKELVPFINSDIDISRYKEENYCIEGDLVIADASEDYADIGKTIEIVNINDEKVLAGLHTFLARPKDDRMSIGFSGYMLQSWSVRKQVMTIAQGTKVRGIATGRLGNIFLTIPQKKEQQKIATFLTSIDTRIQQLEKKKTLLEQYKKGVMQKIFSQEIRFRDDDEEEFGVWEKKRLGDVSTFFSGGTPRSTNRLFYKGDIPFIGSGNISDEYVNSFITAEALNSSSAKLVEKGDLLYALYGATSGEVAISKMKGAINQAVLCIRTEANKNYLYQLLKYNKNKIVETFIQGGQGNLSAAIIKDLKFNLPCLEEQTKIAHFLSALDIKIAVVDEQIEKTKEWKKGMLQKMFV